jgi:mRNA interferase MazF
MSAYKRGQVWYADLGKGKGSEQSGDRPVLIIQNDIGNHHSTTVIVAAMTDKHKPRIPTHVKLDKVRGISGTTIVLLEQIRTVDKLRLSNCIATLPKDAMEQVDAALAISIGL